MRTTSYPILTIQEFGHQLLTSNDIDPIYVVLQEMEEIQRARWCLAYWCLYHAGAASFIAEAPESGPNSFWHALGSAALNRNDAPTGGRWPRGKERRHWRAANAEKSFQDLRDRYAGEKGPEEFTRILHQKAPVFERVSNFVQSHVGFGPWIAFKVADMAEQCLDIRVDFARAEVFMFDTPKEAALMYWRAAAGVPSDSKVKDPTKAIAQVVEYLLEHFQGYVAPNGKRFVGLQEVETILCKWKSHCNGHYPLGNDIKDISHQLTSWAPVSPLAEQLFRRMP